MKGKIIFARGMSRVLFALLYGLDVTVIYYVTRNVMYTAIGAAVILGILALQMGFSLLTLKAHSIRNAPRGDARYLQGCMDEVMERSVSVGRKRKNIHLWIADNESLNCFTVGKSIIVNQSMLELGDRTMLEACLAHELSHVYNLDSYFQALLELNIFIVLGALSLSFFGVAVVIILLVVLLFGLLFSSWVGFTVGTIFGKVIRGCFRLITRIFYYACKLFSTFLYRRQEFEADRYAALLGYSRALTGLFRLMDRTQRHAVETSWVEDLLSDHPSNRRRIAQLEKMDDMITEMDHVEREQREALPYENPFYL